LVPDPLNPQFPVIHVYGHTGSVGAICLKSYEKCLSGFLAQPKAVDQGNYVKLDCGQVGHPQLSETVGNHHEYHGIYPAPCPVLSVHTTPSAAPASEPEKPNMDEFSGVNLGY
jgi:hypothetical protein